MMQSSVCSSSTQTLESKLPDGMRTTQDPAAQVKSKAVDEVLGLKFCGVVEYGPRARWIMDDGPRQRELDRRASTR